MRTLSRRGFFSFLAGVGTTTATAGQALVTAASALAAPQPAPLPLINPLPRNAWDESDTHRVAGYVKGFDVTKGYGLVAPDEGGADILLHVTALRANGYQTVVDGARIDCEVLQRHFGRQVFRIWNMDGSEANERSTGYVAVTPESAWEPATVKWFNRVRGFGFLTRGEGTPDIFVHHKTVQHSGLAELRAGRMVQVRWGRGPKGHTAAQLRRPWLQ